jgi:hypothetical protein
MSPTDPGPDPTEQADTVTVRELQERSNRASWRIVTIVVAVIVAVFVVLGIAVFANPSSRDDLTNPPVGTSEGLTTQRPESTI